MDCLVTLVEGAGFPVVYLKQNKKKAKAEGKNSHAKTIWSQENPI